MEQIDPRHLLIQVAKILKELKIAYFVTGGIAVLVWGRPRFTADIDVVVELQYGNLDKLEKALQRLGKAGYIDKKMMASALYKHGEFNFIDGKTGVKVDFWVMTNDELGREQLKRRIPKKILGQKVYFISPENLILNKMLWYKQSESSRQLEDIESILKISGNKLDRKYLTKWITKLDTWEIWRKVKKY